MSTGVHGRLPFRDLADTFQYILEEAVEHQNWPDQTKEVEAVISSGVLQGFIFPVYTISNGKPALMQCPKMFWNPSTNTVEHGGYSFPVFRLRRFLQAIDSLARPPRAYAEVVRSLAFKELYFCGEQEIAYYHVDGIERRPQESFACTLCGIILPKVHAHIDHQRPVKGGEWEALAKVMRALGLTLAGPKGSKCGQVLELVQEAMNDNPPVRESLFDSPDPLAAAGFSNFWAQFDNGLACDMEWEDVTPRWQFEAVIPKGSRAVSTNASVAGEQRSSLDDRYTLNVEGEVLFSFIMALGEIMALGRDQSILELILARTMNSFANMRPLCGPCNIARGNNVLKLP